MKPTQEQIDHLIRLSLEEDIGSGDITTDSIVENENPGEAEVIAKEPMVLCGLDIFREVFLKLDPEARFSNQNHFDGSHIEKDKTVIAVTAKCSALLKGERTALNILQRLSGIATLTSQFVDRAKPVTVLDTRKTSPGFRVFEKYAVHCGGGTNHRFGLFDAVLIKDNHIKIAGGIQPAVDKIRKKLGGKKKVEVETTNLDEVKQALKADAEIILLDNMPLEMIKNAVALVNGKAQTEVSGSIKLDTLDGLAKTGVDYVSIGALTHSAPAVDLSMNIKVA